MNVGASWRRAVMIAAVCACAGGREPVGSATQKPASDYPITPVPLTSVTITDAFWKPRMERNRTVTIPHIFTQNETTGRIDNFLKAAKAKPGSYQGQRYNDTDVYKALEAASYVLATRKDADLDRKVDALIAIVASAQEPDGYLYTPRSVDPKNPAPGAGPDRWSHLHTSHELYDMGHMIEAAVTHHQATGKRNFLEVAVKAANLITNVFGPGKRKDVPGHPEIELALVKLYRVTGEAKYLQTSKFFLDERGRTHSVEHATFERGNRFFMYDDRAYRQDHIPVVEQTRATGHAVRATYLFAGMTDAAALLNDTSFARTLETVFTDIMSKRVYLTGGLGSRGATEAFGEDYALPNARAYAETCASIGGILWYQRMFQQTGDAKYIDVLERTLYNGYLSGVSVTGDRFFYQNPLESDGKRAPAERSAYFDVACCPANLARLMAQVPALIYAQRGDEIFVNQYVGSQALLMIGGMPLTVTQTTAYPWEGRIVLRMDPAKPIDTTLSIRIPGWSRGDAMPTDLYRFSPARSTTTGRLTLNGKPMSSVETEGYVRLQRTWTHGDTVTLDLPMPVRRVLAHSGVEDDLGKSAIQRGPIVYAVEAVDNGGKVIGMKVPLNTRLTATYDKALLGGVTVIRGPGITAVPYFAWNNRGKGEMAVWIPH
ncbi:MAG: glycoside hydrolase family 127 protein [Vicinamibacterales bacterium]